MSCKNFCIIQRVTPDIVISRVVSGGILTQTNEYGQIVVMKQQFFVKTRVILEHWLFIYFPKHHLDSCWRSTLLFTGFGGRAIGLIELVCQFWAGGFFSQPKG